MRPIDGKLSPAGDGAADGSRVNGFGAAAGLGLAAKASINTVVGTREKRPSIALIIHRRPRWHCPCKRGGPTILCENMAA
ncbi:MAG: hypothetical protein NVS3B7_05510 [Candidatus Elarobacter sp.]